MAFRKKGNRRNVSSLPGCRPSPTNGLPVAPSGISSLDNLIGGGIHVGSALVVEEDEFGSYSRIIMNMFASQGVVSNQALFVASSTEKPSEILDHLPGLASAVQTSGSATDSNAGSTAMGSIREEDEDGGEMLKIAWRYEKPASVGSQSSPQTLSSHTFDLSQKLELPADLKLGTFDGLACPDSNVYTSLLRSLDAFVEKHELKEGSGNVLRLCLHSIGSPLWGDTGSHSGVSSVQQVLQFMHALHVRLRRWSAVSLITFPSHLWTSSPLQHRLTQLADYLVHVDSFVGSSKEQNPLYRDFHGLFHVHKLPCWLSLAPIPLDSTDWAFKLRRKNFSITKLHLPPDLSETASRTQEDPVKPRQPALSCSSSLGAKKKPSAPSLDF